MIYIEQRKNEVERKTKKLRNVKVKRKNQFYNKHRDTVREESSVKER